MFELIFLISLIWLIIYLVKKAKKPEREAKKQKLVDDAHNFLQHIQEHHSVPTIDTQIFLEKGEKAILHSDSTNLNETRAVRRSSGSFGSVRVAKGISLGGYGGSSASSQEWTRIDYGSLTVTNKRIVFSGSKETRDLKIAKIVSASVTSVPFTGPQLEINVSNRKKGMTFEIGKQQNHHIWSAVFQLLQQGADLLNIEDPEFDVSYSGE